MQVKSSSRSNHERMFLKEIKENGPITRAQLAQRLGMAKPTSSSIATQMISRKLVREIGMEKPQFGRPGKLLEINPNGGCAVGLDLNVDYLSIVLTDFSAKMIWQKIIPSNPGDPMEKILDSAEDLIEKALAKGEQKNLRKLGIGVAFPGLVDSSRGVLSFAPNLQWRDLNLRELWEEKFHVSVCVENDANAAALREYHFGAAQGVSNYVYLAAGAGLGAAIVVDGKIFGGSGGFAGEAGHVQVDPNGRICGCGRRGCLETVASTKSVELLVRSHLNDGKDSVFKNVRSPNFEQIVRAAHEGDQLSIGVLSEIGENIGQGIGSLINLLNPEMVVLGGRFSQDHKYLFPTAAKAARHSCLPQLSKTVKVALSTDQSQASSLGAATLVLDEILNNSWILEDNAA